MKEILEMKTKILSLCLILFSLIGYLEWGGDKHQFLFQLEGEVISQAFSNIGSLLHPFVLLPLIGQILLLVSIFQKKPNKLLIYLAIGGLSILFLLMLFIGIIGPNYKIILSTCPFLVTAIYTIITLRKTK